MRLSLALCLALVGSVYVTMFMSNNGDAAQTAVINNIQLDNVASKAPVEAAKPGASAQILAQDMQTFTDGMVKKLREMHAHNIAEVKVQLALLDLRNFILESYPDNGAALFEHIIRLAFPKLSEKILVLINNMDVYQAWHEGNQLALNDLMALERDGKIWKKRNELFGEELAHEIWSDEIDAEEQRQQDVMSTVTMLDTADDITMDERLFLLQSTLQEHYDGKVESFLVDKGMISGIYFNLASVQKDLHQLNEQERQVQINDSRRQLGFSEKDIDYLANQDTKREARWQNGYGYMAKRDELQGSLQGQALDTAMAELQVKFFKHEAPTISKEEQQGFYRYERPRLYGKN